MNLTERKLLAADRAELYAPRPTGGMLMAGFCAGTVALLAALAFAAFYDLGLGDHLWVAAGVAAAGFLIGALGYAQLSVRNREARRTELGRIGAAEDQRTSAEAPGG